MCPLQLAKDLTAALLQSGLLFAAALVAILLTGCGSAADPCDEGQVRAPYSCPADGCPKQG